jgi:hypothetical protein
MCVGKSLNTMRKHHEPHVHPSLPLGTVDIMEILNEPFLIK